MLPNQNVQQISKVSKKSSFQGANIEQLVQQESSSAYKSAQWSFIDWYGGPQPFWH